MCKLRFWLLLAVAGVAIAQSPAQPQPEARAAFDVASVKLHPGTITSSSDPTVRGRTVTGTASTLLDIITTAYGVKYEQISGGPNWVNSDHYDISAKAEGVGSSSIAPKSPSGIEQGPRTPHEEIAPSLRVRLP